MLFENLFRMSIIEDNFEIHGWRTDCCTETKPLIPRLRYHPTVEWKQYAGTFLASSMSRYDHKTTKFRESKTWIVVMVAFVLFLDYTLLTAIVTIYPLCLEWYYVNEILRLPNTLPGLSFLVPIMPQLVLREENAETTFADQNNGANNVAESTISNSSESNGVFFGDDDHHSENASQHVVETNTRRRTGADGIWFLAYAGETAVLNQLYQSVNPLQETAKLGLMFALKPFVQLITIPIIGLAMSKIRINIILVSGFLLLSISSLFFGLGASFTTLYFARALQGIGSSCSNLAGMTLLVEIFQDSLERMKAISRAITGIALGTLFGPVYGGIMYEFYGKTTPFLILALLALAGVVAITIPNMALTLLESALPSWMLNTMNATVWQQGVIFLPDCICYLICSYYIGSIGERFDRWRTSMTGFILLGLSFVLIPLSSTFLQTAVPMLILGFSLGLTDGTMLPELGALADVRHAAVYVAVYALEEIVVCLGYMIGPIFGGIFISCYGFEKTCMSIAVICFSFAPLMYFLKHPYQEKNEGHLMNKM